MNAAPYPADGPGVDVSVWKVHQGDRIIRDGRLVTVTQRRTGPVGDVFLNWASAERDADGIPVLSGVTHVRIGEQETVRLVERPTLIDVPGVAL